MSPAIQGQIKYQKRFFVVALIVTAIAYIVRRDTFQIFFGLGNFSNHPESVAWFGISGNESWLQLGCTLSITITSLTFIYMWLGARQFKISYFQQVRKYFFWIILFSFCNALSEELIFRLSLMTLTHNHFSNSTVMLISAVVFGLAHFRGAPGGISGVLMSTVLGWILSKSVLETGGMFWAIWIHFLQDLVIFPLVLGLNKPDQVPMAPR